MKSVNENKINPSTHR